MSIFYGRTERLTYGFVRYEDQKATEIFCRHYRQYLLLDFLSKSDEDFNDRRDALNELSHCENLLLRWKLHPNWNEEIALREVERLKKLSIRELIMEVGNE